MLGGGAFAAATPGGAGLSTTAATRAGAGFRTAAAAGGAATASTENGAAAAGLYKGELRARLTSCATCNKEGEALCSGLKDSK